MNAVLGEWSPLVSASEVDLRVGLVVDPA